MNVVRKFAADDLKEVGHYDLDGRGVVLKAKNGVIEVADDSPSLPVLETLAADPNSPVEEPQPKSEPGPSMYSDEPKPKERR